MPPKLKKIGEWNRRIRLRWMFIIYGMKISAQYEQAFRQGMRNSKKKKMFVGLKNKASFSLAFRNSVKNIRNE